MTARDDIEREVRAQIAADFKDYGRNLSWGQAVHIALHGLTRTAGEEATAAAATATPTDTNRRAQLLHAIADGGRWKSGDVVRWYEAHKITGLGVRAARHDLAILRDSGAITQHDDKGVRFYTLNTRKDATT